MIPTLLASTAKLATSDSPPDKVKVSLSLRATLPPSPAWSPWKYKPSLSVATSSTVPSGFTYTIRVLPSTPSLPSMPGAPCLTVISALAPGIPSIPSAPAMPSLPVIPITPSLPSKPMPGAPSLPSLPGVPFSPRIMVSIPVMSLASATRITLLPVSSSLTICVMMFSPASKRFQSSLASAPLTATIEPNAAVWTPPVFASKRIPVAVNSSP